MFEFETQAVVSVHGKELVRTARFVYYYDAIEWCRLMLCSRSYNFGDCKCIRTKIIDIETGDTIFEMAGE